VSELLVPSKYDPRIDSDLKKRSSEYREKWKSVPVPFLDAVRMVEVSCVWENKGDWCEARVQMIALFEESPPSGIVIPNPKRMMRVIALPAKINSLYFLGRQGSKKLETKKIWQYKETARALLAAFPEIVNEFARQGWKLIGLRASREAIREERGRVDPGA